MPQQQEQVISWSVLTHEHKERSVDWYWTLGILAVGGAIVAIVLSNILLALILLIGAGCIGYLAARGPREHMVHIDDRGVVIDGTMYPYKSIRSFCISEEERPHLILSVSSVLTPRILIPLEGASLETVHARMKKNVHEIEFEPHLFDSLAEIFGL